MEKANPVIQVEKLAKKFPYHRKEPGLRGSFKSFFHRETLQRIAVNDISFEVEEGEVVGFIGPNGAGKTTTMKMLAGVLYPTTGRASVLGHIPQQRKDEFLKQIAFVMGQKNSLFWELPAMELFLLHRDIYEIPHSRFKESLDLLTSLLDARDILDIQVRRLSLGQRMKCELIVGLIHMPRVLFLDEPTIGLDVSSKAMTREFFNDYNQQTKATIVLTSHYLEDIQSLCRRIIFIDKGNIIFDGLINELIARFAPHVFISLDLTDALTSEATRSLQTLGDVQDGDTPLQCRLRVTRDDAASVTKYCCS